MDAVAAESTLRLSDRYLLGDILGVGGTATVHRATHRESARAVAVKIYTSGAVGPHTPPSHGSETALAGLRHPGLVEIYESGFDADHAYLVMRLIEGRPLSARVHQGPMPTADVVALGAALADTLAHVHARGVVHRDVKPSNILLDGRQVPFLTDFGASRLLDATRVTATGLTVGTPAFMAPEQVRGEHVGPAADVYALGLVLLEAVTGRREYQGGVVEAAVARLHRDPVVPDGLPQPCRRLLAAMTAQDPASRPSAATVAARLRALPGTPRPDAAAARPGVAPRRFGRRRDVWVAAAAALVLLVAAAARFPNLDASAGTTPPSESAREQPVVVPSPVVRPTTPVAASAARPGSSDRAAVAPVAEQTRITVPAGSGPVHGSAGSGGKPSKSNGKHHKRGKKG